jgi:hypothetical protein
MAEPEEISILDEIERLADKEPFSPFAIVMGSGEKYEISAGDTLTFGRAAILIVRHQRGHHLLRHTLISEISVPGDAP